MRDNINFLVGGGEQIVVGVDAWDGWRHIKFAHYLLGW